MITTKFGEDFPNVVSHYTSGSISSHPGHKSAKSGDLKAALSVVLDLINSYKIVELKENYKDAVLVPVISIEEDRNKLPLTYAMVIKKITGMKVETGIKQINETKHTQKCALERLLSRACFSGNVIANQKYILVDDVITTGGILNELRNYIQENGGHVVAATSLGHAQFSTVFAMKKDTIEMIERKFGRDEAEKFIQEIGIGEKLEHITNSEGRYILSFSSINTIRNRIFELGNRKSVQVLRGRAGENANRGIVEEKGRESVVKTLDDVLSRAKERVAQRQQELKNQINREPHRKMSR